MLFADGKSGVDIIVAIIGLVGVLFGAAGAFIAAVIKLDKDKEIAQLVADNAIKVAELTANKDTEINRLQIEKDTRIANLKVRQDLEIEYDKELRADRVKQYGVLLTLMKDLNKYPEPKEMTYTSAQKLAEDFRDWYFNGGGLFMSEGTREKYFDLQDGLKILLQKQQGQWNIASDKTRAAELRGSLERGATWEPPDSLIEIAAAKLGSDARIVPPQVREDLRKLGSQVRTAMTDDILSRQRSYLGDDLSPRSNVG